MKRDKHETLVVFRRYPAGDILALFPTIDAGRGLCTCYQRIGQHGDCDYSHCIKTTAPASPAEYAELRRELEGLGYNLRVIQRYTRGK